MENQMENHMETRVAHGICIIRGWGDQYQGGGFFARQAPKP